MSSATLQSDAISFVCSLVRKNSAIELDATKAYLIEARLSGVARKNGFPTTTDLIRSLQGAPSCAIRQQVVEAMTTNETSFFRDIHPFEALKNAILPELIHSRATARTLNIWSAACSTGQEAYSVAMLLTDRFPELGAWKINIQGTDLSEEVLEKARAGRFSQIEVNRGLSATQLAKYFQRDGMQWELAPALRQMVKFSKLNLIEAWPAMPTMDIIFLRNVLIYFAPPMKKRILEKARTLMASHSVLFLGAAETTMNLDSDFARVQAGAYVYYKLK